MDKQNKQQWNSIVGFTGMMVLNFMVRISIHLVSESESE